MDRKIRFGSYIREITIQQKLISYNDLAPEIKQDSAGNDIPYVPPKLKLRNIDIYRLVQPYVSIRLYDQIKAVLPLALYLILFKLFILTLAGHREYRCSVQISVSLVGNS